VKGESVILWKKVSVVVPALSLGQPGMLLSPESGKPSDAELAGEVPELTGKNRGRGRNSLIR